METDELLVKQILSGDKNAFGTLVQKYGSSVYGLAYHLVRNFADAQDLTERALITAYERLFQLKDPSRFAGWLRKITMNICRMHLRKKKNRVVSIEEVDERKLVSPRSSVKEDLIAKEKKDLVTKAMASLSEQSHLTLTLHYLDGMSYEEIASFLGVTRSAVDSRLQRARKKLREEVLKMTEQEFKEHRLPADFSDKVITQLLEKPKPLEIPGHPIRKIWEIAKKTLSDYTVVEPGPEIESLKDNYPSLGEMVNESEEIFRVDEERMLRSHTTTTLLNQLPKIKPLAKLITAGRCFRKDKEDATHYPIFHQIEGLRLDKAVPETELKETVKRLVQGILGNVKVRFRTYSWPFIDTGWVVEIKTNEKWLEIAGMGIYEKKILKTAGHDPKRVSAFGFGLGIERLAMVKYGIEDIKTFWQE